MHVPLSSYLIFCLVFISTPANFQTRCIPVITFPLCSAKLSTTSVLPISYSRAFLLSLALYRLATYPRSVSLRVVPMWLCGRENDDRVRTLTHHCLSLCSDTLTIAHCSSWAPHYHASTNPLAEKIALCTKQFKGGNLNIAWRGW
jgi:hypothetical protein